MMGLKGVKKGSAVVSPVHANFIVTEGADAKASDALALAEEIKARMKEEHGVELEYEVERWGTRGGETERGRDGGKNRVA
jgi:UDP-N-acetylmuramate dehydrogenase